MSSGDRKLLPAAADILKRNRIKNTDEIASLLQARPRFRVDRRRDLDFHYLDREVTASRACDAQEKARYQASPVQLDLLLVNAEHEIHASLLAPRAQRTRLRDAYPDVFRSGVPEHVDVYVIVHELPASRRTLLDSALSLAPGVLGAPGVSRYLRRICFLEAYLKADALRFRLAGPPAIARGERRSGSPSGLTSATPAAARPGGQISNGARG
jgi:hypothetical protein